MNIVIRSANPSDAPHVAEILMRSWEAAYRGIMPADFIQARNSLRPEQYKQLLAADERTYYVICNGERIVGYMRIVNASEGDDAASSAYDLEQIYLHPDCWRQGIGTQAMAFACALARDAGKSAMVVWVLSENTAAIAFYEKCGFFADGAKRQWNYGKVLEGIRMRRAL